MFKKTIFSISALLWSCGVFASGEAENNDQYDDGEFPVSFRVGFGTVSSGVSGQGGFAFMEWPSLGAEYKAYKNDAVDVRLGLEYVNSGETSDILGAILDVEDIHSYQTISALASVRSNWLIGRLGYSHLETQYHPKGRSAINLSPQDGFTLGLGFNVYKGENSRGTTYVDLIYDRHFYEGGEIDIFSMGYVF